MKLPFVLMFLGTVSFSSVIKAWEVNALLQANVVYADEQTSWLEGGTGLLAYDQSGVNLQQALLKVHHATASGLDVNLVANYYPNGQQKLGLSQGFIRYKPIINKPIRWRGRLGFFYPKMSFENVDIGWLSPYTYTQSAVNSWIGEELRTAGLELSVYSPGRPRKSAISWELHGAVFKGNDPLGTLISWRGFAMHDRQSLHNDQVRFAPYPGVIDPQRINHPDFVQPFHELDGRLGYYLGAHVDYYRMSSLRYYFYDNQADPLAVNSLRLYGWRTKFHSIAVQHKFASASRIISQWISGSSEMGSRYVYINFDAWYVMLSHKIGQHRVSLRYDHFRVQEDDVFLWDTNNSDGHGLTLAWRYNWDKHWQLGLEQHINQNSALNRLTLGEEVDSKQQQTLAVVQYRW